MALPKNQRYIQPQNVREAMEVIQDLFNQYRHEPMTQQLLNYHLGLTQRLQTDIYVTAVKENDPQQLKQLDGMIEAMKTWTQIRTSNRPFNAKMKNFKPFFFSSVETFFSIFFSTLDFSSFTLFFFKGFF